MKVVYLPSRSFNAPLISDSSSFLHKIYNDGSKSLIIDWRMRSLHVYIYRFLLFFLSSCNFVNIASLIPTRQTFLSFISFKRALLIFLDLAIFNCYSISWIFCSYSFLRSCYPSNTFLSFSISKLLCAWTWISNAFSWAFNLSIRSISNEPILRVISGKPMAPSYYDIFDMMIKCEIKIILGKYIFCFN